MAQGAHGDEIHARFGDLPDIGQRDIAGDFDGNPAAADPHGVFIQDAQPRRGPFFSMLDRKSYLF